MSTKDIAIHYAVNPTTILKRLKLYEIPIRYYESVKLGEKFGKLEVISRWEENSRTCRVRCKCGKEFKIRIDGLKNKARLACKQCSINTINIEYEHITKPYWRRVQHNAAIRGLEFNISVEYVNSIFTGRCKLSGRDIGFAKSAYGDYKGETTASLDRIDSSKGYIEDNVQWIHKDVQRMKWSYKQEYFIDLCKSIADNNE